MGLSFPIPGILSPCCIHLPLIILLLASSRGRWQELAQPAWRRPHSTSPSDGRRRRCPACACNPEAGSHAWGRKRCQRHGRRRSRSLATPSHSAKPDLCWRRISRPPSSAAAAVGSRRGARREAWCRRWWHPRPWVADGCVLLCLGRR